MYSYVTHYVSALRRPRAPQSLSSPVALAMSRKRSATSKSSRATEQWTLAGLSLSMSPVLRASDRRGIVMRYHMSALFLLIRIFISPFSRTAEPPLHLVINRVRHMLEVRFTDINHLERTLASQCVAIRAEIQAPKVIMYEPNPETPQSLHFIHCLRVHLPLFHNAFYHLGIQ